MRRRRQRFAVCSALLAAAAVSTGTNAVPQALAQCTPTVVDFQGLPAGTLLGEQLAGAGIHMSAVANEGKPNQLVVFDSNADNTPDADLEVDIGNLAIIPDNVTDADGDGLVDKPSDSNWGGTQTYAFDQPRTVNTFTIVDMDHGAPAQHYAVAYDAAGVQIKRVPILMGAGGNVQVVHVDAENVRRLEITYRDSAGVTRLDLGCPPPPPPAGDQGGGGPGNVVNNQGGSADTPTPPATARLSGPGRCVRRYAPVRVRGTGIRDVTFRLAGRRVARVQPNGAPVVSVVIDLRRRGEGSHRLTARVRFLPSTGARPRTLRMRVRICARASAAPKFTG